MTALLAVLAVLTGSLAFVSAAQATDAPSVTICHATDSRTNPYTVITVNGSSIDEVANVLFNGHGDHDGVVFSATLPKHEKWGDIIPAFGSFPGINIDAVGWIATGCNIPGVYDGEGSFEATHGVLCYNDVIYGPFTSGVVTREATSSVSEAAADEAAYQLAVTDATAILNAMLAGYPEHTDGTCPGTVTFEQSATAGGTVDYCTVEGTTVSITYTGSATISSPVSPEDALFKAQLLATDRASADLQARLPSGATPGACAVTPPVEPTVVTPPVEPAVVAPVLPGTVEEPETVAVPAPATVPVPTAGKPLPATVPAGDGSTVPAIPPYVLALLALGATALAATTVQLVRTTR